MEHCLQSDTVACGKKFSRLTVLTYRKLEEMTDINLCTRDIRHDQDDKENIDVPAPKRAKLSESEYASTSMTKSSVWFAPVNEDIMVSSNEEPLVESVSVSITTTFQQPLQPSPKTVSSKSPESDTAFSFS